MSPPCTHVEEASNRGSAVKPSGPGCKECLQSGSVWVHLRLCLSCGHVGCCDNSPNRHATKHFKHSHHPVIRSYEPGEEWAYCYEDEQFIEDFPAKPGGGGLAPLRLSLSPERL